MDWYKRKNYDLIGWLSTTGLDGEIGKCANVASMRSHGIELTLSTRNIAKKDFKWNTDFIFSKTKNKVTDWRHLIGNGHGERIWICHARLSGKKFVFARLPWTE